MQKLLFYEIDTKYIDYLSNFAEHLFHNAKEVYNKKVNSDGKSKLARRCNDFALLEQKCKEWNGADK